MSFVNPLKSRKRTVSSFNPLVPLSTTEQRVARELLICVPGAGASVTSLMELVSMLPSTWHVYGLQPRGIAPGEVPHTSVESSARCNLEALLPLLGQLSNGNPVHFLGHSYGGLVVFEMGRHLQELGTEIGSLTVLDSAPPGRAYGRALSNCQMREDFASAIHWTLDIDLEISRFAMDAPDDGAFLSEIHGVLLRARHLPPSSKPDILRGAFQTFAAARRAIYRPESTYFGQVQLIQVRDPELDFEVDLCRQVYDAKRWRKWAPKLRICRGPGHHYSVLKTPHVAHVAKWIIGTGETDG